LLLKLGDCEEEEVELTQLSAEEEVEESLPYQQ